MNMEQNNIGIVYLLTNECMPGLVKIGMTSRESMDARLKELYTTGVPMPFECVYACKVDCYKELERALHDAFEPYRVNPSREFFRIKTSQVMGILRLFDKGNITSEVVTELEKQQEDESAEDGSEQVKTKVYRRPAQNYFEMGLKEGDVLTYVHDSSVTCIVKSERKVEYNGQLTHLTPITTELLKAKRSVQPTPHWEFNGRNLSDLYEEWQERVSKESSDEE